MPGLTPLSTHAVLLTRATVTMAAFAANSLLCRAALAGEGMDPYSFTLVRVGAGALVLLLLVHIGRPSTRPTEHDDAKPVPHRIARALLPEGGSWRGAAALLTYALAFSIAYRSLDAGTGALILFAAVQLWMLGSGWRDGERLTPLGFVGVTMAVAGLVTLLWPASGAPSPLGAGLMLTAGAAWGVYSLLGRRAASPLQTTAGNFVRAAPWAVAAWTFARFADMSMAPSAWTAAGTLLALASGAIASGLGYALWYRTLPAMSATAAGVAQLSVPGLAMLGGVVLLGENLTLRGAVATAVTILGVGLTVTRGETRDEHPRRR